MSQRQQFVKINSASKRRYNTDWETTFASDRIKETPKPVENTTTQTAEREIKKATIPKPKAKSTDEIQSPPAIVQEPDGSTTLHNNPNPNPNPNPLEIV